MKKNLIKASISCATIALATSPGFAQDSDVSVSVSIDYVTEYVFRGVSFEDEAIQPGIELGFGDFTIGTWASAGLGSDSLADTDEIDFYAGYSWALSDVVSASVGATWYHFPDGTDTYEGYVGLGFDTAFAPSLTAYYDVELEALTLEGGIGHSIPTGDKTSFDLGLVGGLVTVDGPGDYEWATASAAYSYAINDVGSVYAGINVSLNSEDVLNFSAATPDDSLIWAGFGVSAGF
ncbi:MAG: TorF family putative porin [Pseudomonadota bacterium]